jgi:hypothetical protein
MPEAANDAGPIRLSITGADLHAYISGDLDIQRRREIEGFLACNPDLAAGVMTQLHLRGSGRVRRRRGLAVTAIAVGLAACLGSGAGWAAAEYRDLDGWREIDGGPPPEYVEEAAESRQATDLRQRMNSQVETAELDVREIRQRLRIHLPPVPASWRVRDVQVFPTDEGPSVNLVLETNDHRRLQLFAVAASTTARRPELASKAGDTVAFWQRDGAAYVLSGPRSRSKLLEDASVLGGSQAL